MASGDGLCSGRTFDRSGQTVSGSGKRGGVWMDQTACTAVGALSSMPERAVLSLCESVQCDDHTGRTDHASGSGCTE